MPTTEDAVRLLHRYQRWRRSPGARTLDQAGLDRDEVTAAIAKLLEIIPRLQTEIRRQSSQLNKAYADRKRLHLEISRLRSTTPVKPLDAPPPSEA